MITLTRLNGTTVAINPDLITWIEITPDTTVSLFGGDKLVVKEELDTVIEKIAHWRRTTHNYHGPPQLYAPPQRPSRPPIDRPSYLRLSSSAPPREK